MFDHPEQDAPRLVKEMRRMADLHPQTIWALAMADGARMIERLAARVEDVLGDCDRAHDEGRKEGYQEGMAGARDSVARDMVIEAARAILGSRRGAVRCNGEPEALWDAVRALEADEVSHG